MSMYDALSTGENGSSIPSPSSMSYDTSPVGSSQPDMSREAQAVVDNMMRGDDGEIEAADSCYCITSPLAVALSIPCLPFVPCGCVSVKERTETVLLVFGKYFATLKNPGLAYVLPMGLEKKVISTATANMDIAKSKVADADGNPVIVSGVVSYRIVNSKRAALDVQNATQYVHTQAQTILKQVVSQYPYESVEGRPSLKTETTVIGSKLKDLLQERAAVAGVLICSFELADLSFAPEIAQMMLVRQQAKATVDARATIVHGAVSIVHSAITELRTHGLTMEKEETSRLCTNLLTVICGDHGATPTIAL